MRDRGEQRVRVHRTQREEDVEAWRMRSEVIKLNYYQSRGCNKTASLRKMTRMSETKKGRRRGRQRGIYEGWAINKLQMSENWYGEKRLRVYACVSSFTLEKPVLLSVTYVQSLPFKLWASLYFLTNALFSALPSSPLAPWVIIPRTILGTPRSTCDTGKQS